MADHVAIPDRARRGLRTFLVVATAVLVVILGIVPVILQAVEPIQDQLPKGWYAALVGVAATVVAVAGALQKILTSPVVEQLLQANAPSIAAAPQLGVLEHVDLLNDDERTNLASLRDALDEGDPGRLALDRVLAA